MYKLRQQKPVRSRKRLLLLGLGGVVAIALVVLVLELTDTTHFFHKASTVVSHQNSGSQNTKGESGASSLTKKSSTNPSNQTTPSASQPGDAKSNTGGVTTSEPLQSPTGTFISSHHLPMGAAANSNCSTTAGATCQIVFINTANGTTKSLPAQATDRGGAAYWSWKPQDVGLTPGTWQIKAVATLGGQTKSANDAMNLEVQQ